MCVFNHLHFLLCLTDTCPTLNSSCYRPRFFPPIICPIPVGELYSPRYKGLPFTLLPLLEKVSYAHLRAHFTSFCSRFLKGLPYLGFKGHQWPPPGHSKMATTHTSTMTTTSTTTIFPFILNSTQHNILCIQWRDIT